MRISKSWIALAGETFHIQCAFSALRVGFNENILQQIALNHWYSRDHILDSDLPAEHQLWLAHVGSMTRLMRQHAQSQFDLTVVREQVGMATSRECELLNITTADVYAREIVMLVDGAPWLYARSVFPTQVTELADQSLLELGNQPLGRLFFHSESDIRGETNPRRSIEIGYLPKEHELLQGEMFPVSVEQPLYARRSTFTYQDMPALVQEVFLPAHPLYQATS